MVLPEIIQRLQGNSTHSPQNLEGFHSWEDLCYLCHRIWHSSCNSRNKFVTILFLYSIIHQYLRRSVCSPYILWSVIPHIFVRNFPLSCCLIDPQVLTALLQVAKKNFYEVWDKYGSSVTNMGLIRSKHLQCFSKYFKAGFP